MKNIRPLPNSINRNYPQIYLKRKGLDLRARPWGRSSIENIDYPLKQQFRQFVMALAICWCGISSLTVSAQPTNDLCENAQLITCYEPIMGSTVDATNNALTCDSITNNGSGGVWYKFSGMADTVITVAVNAAPTSTGDDIADSELAVYSGSCMGLNCIAGNDNSNTPDGYGSQVSFLSEGGTDYYFYIQGASSYFGTFEIQVLCRPNLALVPCQDQFTLVGQQSDNIRFNTTEDVGVIISNQTIQTGTFVFYDSGKEILLNPNFSVEPWAHFSAEIDGCDPDEENGIFDQNSVITSCSSSNPVSITNLFDGTYESYTEETIHDSLGLTINVGSAAIATVLEFTSADDEPHQDPTRYKIFGSTDSVDFTTIADANLPQDPDRNKTRSFTFTNSTSYQYYRIQFLNVVDIVQASSIQFSEVQLYTAAGGDSLIDSASEISPFGYVKSPAGEEYVNAVDFDKNTKFLSSLKSDVNVCFTIDAGSHYDPVGFEIAFGGESQDFDPAKILVEGFNDLFGTFDKLIATPSSDDEVLLPCSSQRYSKFFRNITVIDQYRIFRFHISDNCSSAEDNQVNIAEIQIFGGRDFGR